MYMIVTRCRCLCDVFTTGSVNVMFSVMGSSILFSFSVYPTSLDRVLEPLVLLLVFRQS